VQEHSQIKNYNIAATTKKKREGGFVYFHG